VTDLASAVAAGDLDALIRLVDGLCSSREWATVVELRDRCRHALEQRGLQLWPAAEYAEYRLALDAPADFAAAVVTEEAGRFALGPLWEVAASTHPWDSLAPHLQPGPTRALAAHERVLRGEDLSGADVDDQVLEIPLRLMKWEPEYAVATYRSDKAHFGELAPVDWVRIDLPPPGEEVEDDESHEALLDIGSVWSQQSNGSSAAIVVEGRAEEAIAALGFKKCSVAEVSGTVALGRIAWAAASGGAYGRRRGAPMGRFAAWWLAATLSDTGWPVVGDDLERAVSSLRWVLWEPLEFTGGWNASFAVESGSEGMSWALHAVDSYRDEDVLAED
jgi:hypothetical protein